MASLARLAARGLYDSPPPDPVTRIEVNPTLLMSWWCTGFALVIIGVRLAGRYIRSERFYKEDWVMLAGVLPLFIRMAFVHVVLIWGTNNVVIAGLTPVDIQQREVGSRLVLAARIFYATFIWTAKYAICEFLRRMTNTAWQKYYQISMKFIQIFLATTFVAVFIATLAECQPISHYWQVVPDPGPHCRLGYANLMTMGVCDILTDLLLVAFPIPFILISKLPLSRKFGLVLLFSLSLVLVAITSYRVPSVIWHDGLQSYRSLVASLEILAATAVSNFIVIGSFVRDRGVKKTKFKREVRSASIAESVEHGSLQRQITLTNHRVGSDADLAAELGYRLDPELQYPESKMPRPAPVALASREFAAMTGGVPDSNLHPQRHSVGTDSDFTSGSDSLIGVKVNPHDYIHRRPSGRVSPNSSPPNSPRKVSFFDVGGLLDTPHPTSNRPAPSFPPSSGPPTRSALAPPSQRYRSGSQAFLQDIGAFLSTPPPAQNLPPHRTPPANSNEMGDTSSSRPPRRFSSSGAGSLVLNDAGGLLSPEDEKH